MLCRAARAALRPAVWPSLTRNAAAVRSFSVLNLPLQAVKVGDSPKFEKKRKEILGESPRRRDVDGVKHIVAISSAKGGVGKSTTAVNVAVALSQLKKDTGAAVRVGLLDADVYGPSLPKLMNLEEEHPELDEESKKFVPITNYNIQCMSMGFLVEAANAMIWRGPMVMAAVGQMLYDTMWTDVDVLVVDLPPGTGDAQLTLTQSVPLTGAVVVTTPQHLALVDVVRGVHMFNKIIGLVQNMAHHTCTNCGHIDHIFGGPDASEVSRLLSVPHLASVPLLSDIASLSDEGAPVVLARPDSEPAAAYKSVADAVWRTVSLRQRLTQPLRGAPTVEEV